MTLNNSCTATNANSQPCRSPRLREGNYCLMHSPEHTQEVAEARRLGGIRRKREVAVTGAYELGGLGTVADIRRLIEIAVLDTLGLENSVARARAIAYLAQTAIKLLEVGELETRLAQIEEVVLSQKVTPEDVFEIEPHEEDLFREEAAD